MRFEERIVMGSVAMFVVACIVAFRVDDALGHDGRSLTIGMLVAAGVFAVLTPFVIWWAHRAGARR